MEKRIWIIDDEWPDYEIEKQVLAALPEGVRFLYSTPATYRQDLPQYGLLADAVLSQIDITVDADFLAGLTHCQVISNYGAGYNNIDVEAAQARGIAVCYVPGYCSEDIADYVVSAILQLNRPVTGFLPAIRAGKWGVGAVDGFAPRRLSAQTLFLVGFGHIGRVTAEKAQGLGMQVLAYSPHLTPAKARAAGVGYATLDAGLGMADYVSRHLPLNAQTQGIVNAAFLAKMQPSACLINTSRGGIVDTAALVAAVQRHDLRGAVLDVLPQEPPAVTDPILQQPGILVTPHVSYYSPEALAELQRRAAENVLHVLQAQAGADLVTVA